MTIADRLAGELMPVSVLVAGDGAASLAAELEAAGMAACILVDAADGGAGEAVDLAILLAAPDAADAEATRAIVSRLSAASERLLLAPLPLGPALPDDAPALPALPQWFELFAEFGYQPVIDFDAGFVSPGAFLVDRAAIAAESDLSAFVDRLQLGTDAASGRRDDAASLLPEGGAPAGAERQAWRTGLAAAEAALAEAKGELDAERQRLHALAALNDGLGERLRQIEALNAGWEALRHWVRAVVADRGRDTLAALLRDLALLNRMRGDAPPVVPPARRRRGVWPGFRRRQETGAAVLEDFALVRASRLFDAAWYVASTPELAEAPTLDPVFHYVLVGSLRGADPGPWFDTAAYRAATPGLDEAACALVHAIRTGADRMMPSG